MPQPQTESKPRQLKDIDQKIQAVNQQLRGANLRVAIRRLNKKLYLQGTFPSKPGANKDKPHQQLLALGVNANPTGLKVAEAKAKEVSAALELERFDWVNYLKANLVTSQDVADLTVQDWVEKFEVHYFSTRPRTPAKLSSYREDLQNQFRRLPPDQPLTMELMLKAIALTEPDKRPRRILCYALSNLARFAGMDDTLITKLKGNYAPSRVAPKDIPSDELIIEVFQSIKNPHWKSVFAILAVYGCRPSEVFHLDTSRLREPPGILIVKENTKTGSRIVFPCYSYWWEEFECWNFELPNIATIGKDNQTLGSKISRRFRDLGIPFTPYTLRHAWAVRSAISGLDSTIAAKMMGHTHAVHTDIYMHWMNESQYQKAFDLMKMREPKLN